MPPPPKGKSPTKGAKQILMENTATLNFYRNMSLTAFAAYAIITAVFYMDNITNLNIVMNLFVVLIHIGSYQMMRFISRPQYAADKSLLDPGLDLNMEGGMGEHVKDIVILTSITHFLAAFSNYLWFLLTLVPLRAFWLLWVNFLGPWFFQEAPEETEQDEKKKRKMMRKRYQ